jgi:hypothetical protein
VTGSPIRWGRLLPPDATDYRGARWPVAVLVVVNVIGTVRSLIHILATDSGAQSIASMNVHVAGGANIIDLLAQWGGAQLLEAIIIWVILARYRGLVPLMLLIVTLEQALRTAIGSYKPLVTAHTPPGALSWALLPLVAVTLIAALTTGHRRDRSPQEQTAR